jgi:hypothetical protein
MLERTGNDCLLAMFEVYFDDSGTDGNSEIAVAACYISTKKGWDEFVKEWNYVLAEEQCGEAFHMVEFVAKPEYGYKPYCDWDNTKKDRVYGRLAKIINENKWTGITSAVPKKTYDAIVPERIRNYHGYEHYTFAVRMCLMRIADWREKCGITLPMQYVFSWEMGRKKKEIESIWENIHESWESKFGIEPEGVSFQRMEKFKPLQAADILAWQMRCHMQKIFPLGHDSLELTHPGFAALRVDQDMDLGFFSDKAIKDWVKDIEQHEAVRGKFY